MPSAPNIISNVHGSALKPVAMDLSAAIISIQEDLPRTLVVPPPAGADRRSEWDRLPYGPFDPIAHRTMEIGLRAWVAEQTGLELGYVEQLYTFGDRGRHAAATGESDPSSPHTVSIGYLALTRAAEGSDAASSAGAGVWRDWYGYFPWEDWRERRPPIIDEAILPGLQAWVDRQADAGPAELPRGRRADRVRVLFALDGLSFDDDKVLERYELLYEAGLVQETVRDGRPNAVSDAPKLGEPMQFDHRRILATAMGRLRGKLKYRPVVFELMPETFTLFELQRTVEALTGVRVHKQNFRRLVAKSGLVEATGRRTTKTGGRPAEQFRFRREALAERAAAGLRATGRRG